MDTAAIDQIEFMQSLFDLDSIQNRISYFIDLQNVNGLLRPESKYLLQEVFLKGQVYRKEMARITGKSAKTARSIMKKLMDHGLLISDDATGPVRINFPVNYIGYFFPKLYPETIEATLNSKS
ncbi:MAG: hypothetical protein H7282_16755 [Cytophagaceae bacterium]|nr:hypothetical protein [Cytophagaceae bacterium]